MTDDQESRELRATHDSRPRVELGAGGQGQSAPEEATPYALASLEELSAQCDRLKAEIDAHLEELRK